MTSLASVPFISPQISRGDPRFRGDRGSAPILARTNLHEV
jgi:hypothetical protein